MIIPEKCKIQNKNLKIVLEENRSKITFINENRENITVVTVDGCAINNGVRCDYLLITTNKKEHYVELKGSDLDHAISQIERTIELLSIDKRQQEKLCFIISTRCPLLTTKIQELKLRFKKLYNSTLLIKNRHHEHPF